MELSGRVALVTGSSRGIGQAIALALAEAGADVAVHYVSSRQAAEETAQQVSALGRRATVISGDVSDRVAVEAMTRAVQQELGTVDILVNNGVVFQEVAPIWKVSEEQWDRLFAVNVKGALLTMQAVVPSMQERRSGAILNISSLGSEVVMAGMSAYISCKGAINSLTRSMALELAPWNIRANALAPGHIATKDNIDWVTGEPGREERFRQRIALGRLGKREEVGKTAVFLVSDGAGYITGQVIYVEGGIMTWQGPIV